MSIVLRLYVWAAATHTEEKNENLFFFCTSLVPRRKERQASEKSKKRGAKAGGEF